MADELHIQITWRCARCPATSSSSFRAPVDRAPQILPPPGWTLALGSSYCPRHKVDVKVTTDNVLQMPPPLLRGEN